MMYHQACLFFFQPQHFAVEEEEGNTLSLTTANYDADDQLPSVHHFWDDIFKTFKKWIYFYNNHLQVFLHIFLANRKN